MHKRLQACVAADSELKGSAQRAFQAYFKSIGLMRDKTVFDVSALEPKTFAVSLGLVVPPRIRIRGQKKAEPKNEGSNKDPKEGEEAETPVRNNNDKSKFVFEASESSSDEEDGSGADDFLTCKRMDHDLEDGGEDEATEDKLPTIEELKMASGKVKTKAALAKKLLKKNIQLNEKVTFDDDGESVPIDSRHKDSDLGRKYEKAEQEIAGIDIGAAREVIRAEDAFDRKKERARLKERNKEKKLKKKEAMGKRLSEAAKKSLGMEGEEDEGDDFTASDDDDSDGPNLDWLPDPDKVYGKKDDDSSEEESATDSEPESPAGGKKRKWQPPKKPKTKKFKATAPEESDEESGYVGTEGLADAEALALQVLGK